MCKFSSVAQSRPTLCNPVDCSSLPCPSPTPRRLLQLASIESVMPSSHLIVCRPLLLLPPIPPSIRVFSNESAHRIRWSKYWSFSLNISPSNEHLGLISFRIDWLDLLTVQGTLKSFVEHRFPGGSEVKVSAWNAGDPGSIPGLGRSPGEGNGNPLQYSCLENPTDGGAWWATVHRGRKESYTTSLSLSKSL